MGDPRDWLGQNNNNPPEWLDENNNNPSEPPPQFAVSNPFITTTTPQQQQQYHHNPGQICYGHVTPSRATTLPDHIDDVNVDSLVTDMSRLRVVAPPQLPSPLMIPAPSTYSNHIQHSTSNIDFSGYLFPIDDELYQNYVRFRYLMGLNGDRFSYLNPNMNDNGISDQNAVPLRYQRNHVHPGHDYFRARNSPRSGFESQGYGTGTRSRARSRTIDPALGSGASLASWYENQRAATELRPGPIFSLQELSGQVCFVAKDPHLRCFLEEKIAGRDQAFIDLIFFEVKTKLFEMITDHSANHLIQKLLSALNEDQTTVLII